jgi:hypothetical protein
LLLLQKLQNIQINAYVLKQPSLIEKNKKNIHFAKKNSLAGLIPDYTKIVLK